MDVVLTLIIMPFAWAFNKMFTEVKRLQIFLIKQEKNTQQDKTCVIRQGRVMEALQTRR